MTATTPTELCEASRERTWNRRRVRRTRPEGYGASEPAAGEAEALVGARALFALPVV